MSLLGKKDILKFLQEEVERLQQENQELSRVASHRQGALEQLEENVETRTGEAKDWKINMAAASQRLEALKKELCGALSAEQDGNVGIGC